VTVFSSSLILPGDAGCLHLTRWSLSRRVPCSFYTILPDRLL
jgi:hypothetical protein